MLLVHAVILAPVAFLVALAFARALGRLCTTLGLLPRFRLRGLCLGLRRLPEALDALPDAGWRRPWCS
jgi:hypothetical protein